MYESEREDLHDDRRTPDATDSDEPAVKKAAGRYPYWLIVLGFIAFALVAIFVARLVWPG